MSRLRVARFLLRLSHSHIELVEVEAVDIFTEGGPPQDYLARHPFGRIPAFEHEGFRLYETNAISHYVDAAFVGPALMPDDLRQRARAHASRTMAYMSIRW